MLRARLLDDKFAALYRAGKIHGGVFLGRGQEAFSAAIGVSLEKGDVFAPLIRDAAGRLAFGEPSWTPSALISVPRSARCAGATAMSIAAGRAKVICR